MFLQCKFTLYSCKNILNISILPPPFCILYASKHPNFSKFVPLFFTFFHFFFVTNIFLGLIFNPSFFFLLFVYSSFLVRSSTLPQHPSFFMSIFLYSFFHLLSALFRDFPFYPFRLFFFFFIPLNETLL